jgi:hypothetical protein
VIGRHPGEYEQNFVEVRPGSEINAGDDLGGTGLCAVNFTGAAGASGATWLTRYSSSVPPGDVFNAVQGMCVGGDVLISKFNNAKGAGW